MWFIKSSVCLLVGGGDLTRHLHVFKSTGWHHCHFHRLLCNKIWNGMIFGVSLPTLSWNTGCQMRVCV